jgi:hypothetical protein
VNESVSHACHLFPFDLWKLVTNLLWNLLGRLTNNLDASNKCALSDLVMNKGIEGDLRHLRSQKVRFLQDIAEKFKH